MSIQISSRQSKHYMATERLPKEIYKTAEWSLMFTSKWALEPDLWYIEKKQKKRGVILLCYLMSI